MLCFVAHSRCWFLFFKQKTADERRISDWSSDVCSSDLPIAQRQACLHKAADILTENAEQLARLFTREQGRPTDAAKSEIDIAVAWLHAYAEMAPSVEVIDKGDRKSTRLNSSH